MEIAERSWRGDCQLIFFLSSLEMFSLAHGLAHERGCVVAKLLYTCSLNVQNDWQAGNDNEEEEETPERRSRPNRPPPTLSTHRFAACKHIIFSTALDVITLTLEQNVNERHRGKRRQNGVL